MWHFWCKENTQQCWKWICFAIEEKNFLCCVGGRGATSLWSCVQENLSALWAMMWRTVPLRKTTLFFCVPSSSPSPPSHSKMCLTEMFEHGFNIKRVTMPCRDIRWGDPGCAGTGNVTFIELWQLLSSHLHFPLWFSVQACLSCCQVTGDSKSFSSRHSQDGFFFILASLQSPAIIRSF